jgi:hypothetical protein
LYVIEDIYIYVVVKGHRGVIVWYLDLPLPMQSVPITTEVVNLNPSYDQVYSIQHYVIKFASDLWQVSGFLRVLRFPPPIKLDCHNLTEILLKVTVNTIALTLCCSIDDILFSILRWQR